MPEKLSLKVQAVILASAVALTALITLGVDRYFNSDSAALKPSARADSEAVFGYEQRGIAIDVKGAVAKPGYYETPLGTRAKGAIDLAGGALENADLDSVNLARVMSDGEELFVPFKSPPPERTGEEEPASETNPAAAPAQSASSGGALPARTGKVNINTASKTELMSLDGIGEVLAGRIIQYREKNGGFDSPAELKNVSGIGDSKYAALKDKITV